MELKQTEDKKKEIEILLTFLEKTKEGTYAKVDISSIPYARLNEQREETYDEDYYYGIS